MKKYIAIILTLILAVGMVGCMAEKTEPSPTDADTSADVSLSAEPSSDVSAEMPVPDDPIDRHPYVTATAEDDLSQFADITDMFSTLTLELDSLADYDFTQLQKLTNIGAIHIIVKDVSGGNFSALAEAPNPDYLSIKIEDMSGAEDDLFEGVRAETVNLIFDAQGETVTLPRIKAQYLLLRIENLGGLDLTAFEDRTLELLDILCSGDMGGRLVIPKILLKTLSIWVTDDMELIEIHGTGALQYLDIDGVGYVDTVSVDGAYHLRRARIEQDVVGELVHDDVTKID